ncbi:S1-C subfamily serine protease [Microvirga flocculans]|uniref:S1-C subfamily serine protease n=1 Tax=Microvirga flocculans TaxID=217168 RepID=A0A7W6IDX7_9HYPH|nr:S1C family serine protease [Microvirga flocculans]MBB4039697.1 S1-C subfamily serine protease [Microvirga flocculans]
MPSTDEWEIPPEFQPDPRGLDYDLKKALGSVVSLRARVPEDAFTAETLGVERSGQGVAIRDDGLVVTIGYLIAEAEEIWLSTNGGRVVQAHVLAYDYESGFGLVQASAPLGVPVLALGDSRRLFPGDQVVIGGSGGLNHALAAHVVACQEFAGYWEYLIEGAIFTAPAHPNWGGAALIGPRGDLVGIGSLQLQHQAAGRDAIPLNMSVPIDLLKPILDDLLTIGGVRRPPRPWLGFYVAETDDDQITIIGLASEAPAQRAGLRSGDRIHAVAGKAVTSLAEFYRAMWALGDAGVDVPLSLEREGDRFDVTVRSADRGRFMKTPRLQ